MDRVATVNLRDFTHGTPTEQQQFVRQLGDSLVETGFVKVSGHGVDAGAIDAAYRAAVDVFALPDEVKRTYERLDLHGARGIVPFGKEQAKDASIVDLKEFWHIGAPGGPMPNVWPAEVPAFQPATTELYLQMELAAQTMLEALAVFFHLPRRTLADLVVGANSLLRVLHYPPLRDRSIPGAVRAAAHEDIDFITLLPAATDAGLELRDRSGTWQSVDGIDGEIVADAGDMLSRYLNGRIPSTTHRVVNPDNPDAERYSMPFFCQPRPDVVLRPPDQLLATGEVVENVVTAGEYHRERMEQIRLTK